MTIMAEVGGRPSKLNIRILGLDTPEIRGRGKREGDCAKKVQQVVEQMALHKFVQVGPCCLDKYGRLLCSPTLEGSGANIAERLLDAGLGRCYQGGQRLRFSDVELNRISAAADRLLAANGEGADSCGGEL
jgi:endonuclease YncB( thermonuclease family)